MQWPEAMSEVLLREGAVGNKSTLLMTDDEERDVVLAGEGERVSGVAAAAEEQRTASFGGSDTVELADGGDTDLLSTKVLDLSDEVTAHNVDASIATLRCDDCLGRAKVTHPVAGEQLCSPSIQPLYGGRALGTAGCHVKVRWCGRGLQSLASFPAAQKSASES